MARTLRPLIGGAVVVASLSVMEAAAARDADTTNSMVLSPSPPVSGLNSIPVFVEATTEANWWTPSFSQSQQAHPLVDYATEGFLGYSVEAGIGLNARQPLIHFGYSAPFNGTSRQKELLRLRNGRASEPEGMEEYLIDGRVLQAVPAIYERIVDNPNATIKSVLGVVSAVGGSYERRHFFGSASALENMLYVSQGAYISGTTLKGPLSPLNKGDSLSYRTTFQRYAVTLDLARVLELEVTEKKGKELKVGYFRTTYRRPTENSDLQTKFYDCGGCATGWRFYLLDADFRSEGLAMEARMWDRSSETRPGSWGFDTDLTGRIDIGMKDSINIHGTDISLYGNKAVSHVSAGIGGNLGTSYKISSQKEFYAGIYGSFDAHFWDSDGNGLSDKDVIYQLGLRAGLRF